MSREHNNLFRASLVISGLPPSELAKLFRMPLNKFMDYLYALVGEGFISRSQIISAIDKKTRDAVEEIVAGEPKRWDRLSTRSARDMGRELRRRAGVNVKDGYVYWKLRDPYLGLPGARVLFGDTYEYIVRIELFLHKLIREKLVERFGEEDEKWWQEGIPEQVREACEERRNGPGTAAELYCYTTLIDLKRILKEKWDLFGNCLPGKVAVDKKEFLSDLQALNEIRNRVMHPCKGMPPTEDDFEKLRLIMDKLELRKQGLEAIRHKFEMNIQMLRAGAKRKLVPPSPESVQ